MASKAGYFEIIRQATRLIQHATDLVSLEEVVEDVMQRLGISWYSCLQMLRPGGRHLPQLLIGDVQHPWTLHYRKRKYYDTDPAARFMINRYMVGAHVRCGDWFSWSEIQKHVALSERGKQIFSEAADFGLGEGVVVPIIGEDHDLAFFSAAGDVLKTYERSDMGTLAVLLVLIHGVHRRLSSVDRELVDSGIPRLSPNQCDVLGLRAQGLTVREIAAELAFTEVQVKNLLRLARLKLNASNNEQAVSVAVSTGQIMPTFSGHYTPVYKTAGKTLH